MKKITKKCDTKLLTANDLHEVGGGNNPIYKPSGSSGYNPLYASEAEVMNNPLYEAAGTSGYNPLHAV